jgi:uncharacterized protein (TIGR00725 family)
MPERVAYYRRTHRDAWAQREPTGWSWSMRTVIGVMGSGEDGDAALLAQARELGAAIAGQGWILLNGGRGTGVMDASAQGAAEAGGLVVGVLPDADLFRASSHLSVAIRTGMGDARNAVNALSSDVVIAMRGGTGTLSEVALALGAGRTVVALDFDPGTGFEKWRASGQLVHAQGVAGAIAAVRTALGSLGERRES